MPLTAKGQKILSEMVKGVGVISGVRQATSFDGSLLRIGGPGDYTPLQMQNLSGEILSGFSTSRSLAKTMSGLLFKPIRVTGIGSWDRSAGGEWKLAKMLVQSYEVLRDDELKGVVRELQAASVTWPPDADERLWAERETDL